MRSNVAWHFVFAKEYHNEKNQQEVRYLGIRSKTTISSVTLVKMVDGDPAINKRGSQLKVHHSKLHGMPHPHSSVCTRESAYSRFKQIRVLLGNQDEHYLAAGLIAYSCSSTTLISSLAVHSHLGEHPWIRLCTPAWQSPVEIYL